MKTFVKTFILLALSVASLQVNAQSAMTKGTQIVQAGIGLGGWSGVYTSQTPIINAAYMTGIKDNLGPGNLSVGGQIGYKHAAWHSWTFNYTYVAGRAAWHPHFVKNEKLDVYGGLTLGVYHLGWDAGADGEFIEDLTTTSVAWSIFAGARYQFTDNIGAYAELGTGLGWLNAGVCYKF